MPSDKHSISIWVLFHCQLETASQVFLAEGFVRVSTPICFHFSLTAQYFLWLEFSIYQNSPAFHLFLCLSECLWSVQSPQSRNIFLWYLHQPLWHLFPQVRWPELPIGYEYEYSIQLPYQKRLRTTVCTRKALALGACVDMSVKHSQEQRYSLAASILFGRQMAQWKYENLDELKCLRQYQSPIPGGRSYDTTYIWGLLDAANPRIEWDIHSIL